MNTVPAILVYVVLTLVGCAAGYKRDRSEIRLGAVVALVTALFLVGLVVYEANWPLMDFVLLRISHRSTGYLLVCYAVGTASLVLLSLDRALSTVRKLP